MAVLCIAGQTYTLEFSLVSQANPETFQTAPTIAAGDFRISINGGAYDVLDNTPTVTPAGGCRVQAILSATETTAAGHGGLIYFEAADAAGAEWYSLTISVRVHANSGDVALTGADGDTLETLSDQIDLAATAAALAVVDANVDDILDCTCGGGAVAFTYTVTDTDTGLPIDGVFVWVSTDAGGANVVWSGYTDAFGVARSLGGTLPMLDPGTYYFWKQRAGYVDDQNPDTEVVT